MQADYLELARQAPKYIILGCQGSGTNLASRLLQRTLDFSVVHDRCLIFNAAAKLIDREEESMASVLYRRVRNRLLPPQWRRRLMLKRHYRQAKHFSELPREVDASLIKSPANFATFFYAFHAHSTEATHLGLKSDDLWESLPLIEDVIPKHRFIHLVRDPRDNAISISNKDFGPRNLFAASDYVRLRMQKYEDHLEHVAEKEVVRISYEGLLNHPNEQMEKIAHQWDLALHPNYQQIIDEMQIRHHNQNKWEKLSSNDLAVMNAILGPLIERYDYPLPSSHRDSINSFERLKWQTDDIVRRVQQRAYKTCRNLLFP